MKKAYLNSISYYLPEDKLDNIELAKEFPEWSVDKISRKTGIFNRHISGTEESSADMAVKAANSLFSKIDFSRDRIDFILLCTQSPDYFLPTTSCIVHEQLKLKNSCGALDFNLGCSGYIYGLGLAKGLIASGQAEHVLLITVESYSKFIHPKDKGNRTIFGDAAAASIISANKYESGGEILNFVHGTDGSGAESLIVRTGGNKFPVKDGVENIDDYGNIVSNDHLYMNGRDVFNFTLERVPLLIEDVLGVNDLRKDEIQKFVFHQANKFMLNHLRKKCKIEEDKFVICLENTGNTVSSTVPIALFNIEEEINENDLVLLAGFGVGLSWSGVVVKY